MTAATIADLIRQGRRTALAGRDAELRLLRQVTAPGGPVVVYVHGPAGIGKTALISALDACLEDEGVRRMHITAGAVEPTPTAILTALGRLLDHEAKTVAELAAALASAKDVTVVMVDDVDTWRLAASWLRAELLPALPASTRFVLAGAVPPPPAWSIDYGQYFLDLKLGALPRAESDAAVAAAGLPAEIAERIWLLSGGHPLGLRMAIHAASTGSLGTARDAGELANAILHAIGDSDLRRAVEACAIVRRANRALMSAILETDEPVPLSLLEAVEALPFATRDAEGIYIAEPVRRALVDWMSGVEAERYQLWRKTAADWIVNRLRAAGRSGRWRHMADLLHLLDQPTLRNAFFPPEEAAPPVEPARADDFGQIFEIAELRDGPDERARIEGWARRLPHRFSVARGSEGEVLAFYLFARQDDPHSGLAALDPLFAAWQAHLAANPVEGEILFIRQMSARARGAYPAGRTACILDLKRNYIERWGMARIYCYAIADDRDLLHRLGFRPLEQPQAGVPDTMVLEVPGGDIIEWVSALVDASPRGKADDDDLDFARDRREIVVDGRAIELTPLEAQVLGELIDRTPAVVRREDLIERIWRRAHVGSNVVDTIVRTLRKKLGPKRDCIQTIPKAGYRYVRSGTPAERAVE
ncbi:MAG TPA: winged helix-turn-helix domain-containing protein [Bradyrhizobium sp.]|nr:winged helix-turn-helix domain-containing protein [Bradyrhizobium sp.]